ncbi:hypothetical protein F383_21893 [Gossypium arboreum]|uniref:Uncharacterized protein n=1 Tax=Gossypium arboreum TaxID=29729 RepID=A0A0B0NWX0_GOSAR|nr:hypothetical protein F383_21893 [Gossypium arboreum]
MDSMFINFIRTCTNSYQSHSNQHLSIR